MKKRQYVRGTTGAGKEAQEADRTGNGDTKYKTRVVQRTSRGKKKKYNNNKKAPKGPASKSTQQRSSHGGQSGADAERLRAADDCWEP